MQYTATQLAIIKRLSNILAEMGAQSDLMCIIGSWGDTLPDEEILQMLNDFNEREYAIVDSISLY